MMEKDLGGMGGIVIGAKSPSDDGAKDDEEKGKRTES